MKGLRPAVLGGLILATPPAAAEPVEYLAALRQIEASSLVDGASDGPAGEFAAFESEVEADGEFWGPVATARQRSEIGPWKIELMVEGTGDTESGGFGDGNPGTGRSECEVSFRVSEPVGFRLSGFVSGYDGVGRIALGGVFASSATTVRPDPENEWDTTPGVDRFELSGVLPPGDYLLSASGEATPQLGGWGGGEVDATLEFVPLTLDGWLQRHGVEPGANLSSDGDGDGKSLLTEAVFHLDPSAVDAAGATPVADFAFGDAVAILTYPLERSDLDYRIEWTADFRSWQAADGVSRTAENLTTTATFALPAAAQLGVRLNVTPRDR